MPKKVADDIKEQIIPKLGSLPDPELARMYHCSPALVYQLRVQRRIQPYRRTAPMIEWTEARIAQLGKDHDSELASRWGTSTTHACRKRRELGIPTVNGVENTYRPIPVDLVQQLGCQPDTKLAKAYQLSVAVVSEHRRIRGIPAYVAKKRIIWTDGMIRDLEDLRVRDFARTYGMSVSSAQLKRLQLGIPPARKYYDEVLWTDEMVQELGHQSDQVIANKYKIGRNTVRRKRIEMNIIRHRHAAEAPSASMGEAPSSHGL